MQLRHFIFCLTFLLFPKTFQGQNTDKETVRPGETVYSISKRYGLSENEFLNINPELKNNPLKSGQIVNVPRQKALQAEERKFELYTVEKGDTKFAIAKKTGISVSLLEKMNPEMSNTIEIGDQIKIPVAKTDKTVQKTSKESEKTQLKENKQAEPVKTSKIPEKVFEEYTVQPKETLFSLSQKANMTEKEFLNLNPQAANQVQAGMKVKMPKITANTISQTENAKKITAPVSVASVKTVPQPAENTKKTPIAISAFKAEKKGRLWNNLSLETEKTISFIIPFTMTEYDNILKNSETADERLKKQADFIKGSIIAVNSLKNEGVMVKTEFITIDEFVKQPELRNKIKTKSSALILTSDTAENSNLITAFTEIGLPVIVAQPFSDYLNVENIYNALPSLETERKAIFGYLKKQDAQIIVFEEKGSADIKNQIAKYYPNAKTFTISESSALNNEKLKSLMSASKSNLIILNCIKSSSMIAFTTALLKIAKNYKIETVIPDSERMPDFEKVSSNRFKILKMIYPSTLAENQTAANFIQEYTQKNNQEPNSQILKGYDVTTDSILRLFQKESFQETAETIESSQLSNRFDYQKNNSGSFSNNALNIIQLEENGSVKKLK